MWQTACTVNTLKAYVTIKIIILQATGKKLIYQLKKKEKKKEIKIWVEREPRKNPTQIY